MDVLKTIIVKKHCYFFHLSTERQVEDIVKFCCTDQNTSVLGIDTMYNLCDMWVTDSRYQNKRLIGTVFLGPAIFQFTKEDHTFTQFALELQASNPETRILKKISIDMENAIFNGVQSLFPGVSKLYCVCHMKERDKIKVGKLFAKFKYSENEKVFKAKQEKILVGKKSTDFGKFMLFYIRQITFPSKLCTSFF